MNKHQELERLFRQVTEGSRKIITLSRLSISRPLFWAMDCRGKARDLRAIADELERVAEEDEVHVWAADPDDEKYLT